MKSLLPQRLAARFLNLLLVFCLLAFAERVMGRLPVEPYLAWGLYEGLVLLFGGTSLGRFFFRLSVQPVEIKPQPHWMPQRGPSMGRLFVRELILWLFLPLILLLLPFGKPLHERLTGLTSSRI